MTQLTRISVKPQRKYFHFQALITLIVSVALLYLAPLQEWERIIPNIHPTWLFLGACIVLVIGLCDMKRVEALLPVMKCNKRPNLKITFSSACVSQLPLGVIGGDVYRALAFQQLKIEMIKAAGVIVVLRGLGLISTLITGCVGGVALLFFGRQENFSYHELGWVFTGGLVMGLTLILGIFMTNLPSSRFKFRCSNHLKGFLKEVKQMPARAIQLAFSLSLLMSLCRIALLWVCCFSVGITMHLGVIAMSFCAGMVAAIIPVSFAGLGFREGGFSSILVAFGTPISIAIIIALLFRAITLVGSIIGLVLTSIHTPPPKET